MGKLGVLVYAGVCAIALVHPVTPADASETLTYTYDTHGRLVAAISSGTVNNGRTSTYCYDRADNRTQVISDVSGVQAACSPPPGSCTLRTYHVTGDDETWKSISVVEIGTCGIDVPLSYSIQYVSGPGSYTDLGWFYSDGVLSANETYESLYIRPTYHSVPAGQQLILQVTFTTSTPGVTISPNVSTVTIESSY